MAASELSSTRGRVLVATAISAIDFRPKPFGRPSGLSASSSTSASLTAEPSNRRAASVGEMMAEAALPPPASNGVPSFCTHVVTASVENWITCCHGKAAAVARVMTEIMATAPCSAATRRCWLLRCAPTSLSIPIGEPNRTTAIFPLTSSSW